MAHKFNPFRPDKMCPPGIFAGRLEEIKTIDHCLLQTKNGNPQHFLIEGERGIGKSSLFWLEQFVASGQIETMVTNTKLDFIVVSISLQEQDDYYSIIRKIMTELKNQLAKRDSLKAIALAAWDFISRFEAGGIRYNKEASRIEETELLAHLQSDFVKLLCDIENKADGVLLLLDEADKPSFEAGLGLICKLLTEELSRKGCEHLCIGIAGLPGVLQSLKDSHESSPRIFKIMNLQPLEKTECESVIETGLKEASEKNGFEITITAEAMASLVSLSEGYPHFLQEFAYAAFEEDADNVIDRQDVLESLFRENGPFEQLGRKFFAQYYAAPSSDDYRTVLHSLALHFDNWVDRATLIKESGLKDRTIDNALRALKEKNIIIQDGMRRGHYRLPTRAFAVWTRLQQKAADVASGKEEALSLFDAAADSGPVPFRNYLSDVGGLGSSNKSKKIK